MTMKQSSGRGGNSGSVPVPSPSTSTTPLHLHARWGPTLSSTLTPTTTSHHHHHHNDNSNAGVDYVDDDLFGSAAWKKNQRACARKKGRKPGQKNGDEKKSSARLAALEARDDGVGGEGRRRRRWAVVSLVEERVRDVGGLLSAVSEWLTAVASSRRGLSSKEKRRTGAAGGRQRNGVAVTAADGSCSPAGAAQSGTVEVPRSCELSADVLVQQVSARRAYTDSHTNTHARTHARKHTHTHIYIYIYIYTRAVVGGARAVVGGARAMVGRGL